MPIVYRKLFVEETEEELLAMSRATVTEPLTERQQRFCEYYVKNMNVKLAAIKAGYTPSSANSVGWKIRQDYKANRYIAWLKARVGKECHVTATDIIDQYARIAFADMTDFVSIRKGKIMLKDDELLDGQIVSKVKEGRDGISIELVDKLSALSKLERYFDVMPKDWHEKIEEKKLEIMRERLEIEKLKIGQIEEIDGDDGFLDALKQSASEVWNEQ